MSPKTGKSVSFDQTVVADLACPVCHGGFELGDQRLVCLSCGRAYPIVDGIPILIADRAVSPAHSNILSN